MISNAFKLDVIQVREVDTIDFASDLDYNCEHTVCIISIQMITLNYYYN